MRLSSEIVQPLIERIAACVDCKIEVLTVEQEVMAAAGEHDRIWEPVEEQIRWRNTVIGLIRAAGSSAKSVAQTVQVTIESILEQVERYTLRSAYRSAISSWAQSLTNMYEFNDQESQQFAQSLGIDVTVQRSVFLIRSMRHRALTPVGPYAEPSTQLTLESIVQSDALTEQTWSILAECLGDSSIVAEVEPHLFLAAVPSGQESFDERSTARTLVRRLRAQGAVVKIGIGGRRAGLLGYRESFELARQTLRLQDRFSKSEPMLFSDWGALRLIESVPRAIRTEFLSVYANRFASLDIELMKTLRAFLDHDLSVKSASEFLHIHRNTLIYRLSQLEAATGLDPRRFEDAVLVRILLWCQDIA